MATVQRKLVHKQFNSPIGLYSEQNIKDSMDRELKAFRAQGHSIVSCRSEDAIKANGNAD
uniref:Zasp-like motif domain-containing protein n=1 Tax=Glossina morsitans morsitans TaxID=37546 RepID=A0A1B0G282_GLOMM